MIVLHKLLPPENLTLFEDCPALNKIWEVPQIQGRAKKFYQRYGTKGDDWDGEIFAIKKGKEIIGLIGWYHCAERRSQLRLRHYGLIPSARGKGYGKKALRLLLKHLADVAPKRHKFLIEMVSVKRQVAAKVIRHFEKLGFEKFKDPEHRSNGFGKTLSLRIKLPRGSI